MNSSCMQGVWTNHTVPQACGAKLLLVIALQGTAELYNKLGLQEYEAMEAFVRYDPHRPSRLFKQGPCKLCGTAFRAV